MEFRRPDVEYGVQFAQFRKFWIDGSFCDVLFKSRDGHTFKAHRLVLSAGSDIFATMLLNDSFAESKQICVGEPVHLDVTSGALNAALCYLYWEKTTVEPSDGVEVLKFAHAYGLHSFAHEIAKVLPHHLNSTLAVQIFVECQCLQYEELDHACEKYITQHFETYLNGDLLSLLTAGQLGRILKSPRLRVSREEVALQVVLAWRRAEPDREKSIGVLLQHIDFPSLSLRSLRTAHQHAEIMGPSGIDLQREVWDGIRKHRSVVPDGEPRPKRRCLRHWWPEFGASEKGGVVVATGLEDPWSLTLHAGALYIADNGNECVWKRSENSTVCKVVAGKGAAVNGTNDVGSQIAIAIDHEGRLLVIDNNNRRLLRFTNLSNLATFTGGEVLHSNLTNPMDVSVTPCGHVYILDQNGTRVQKIEGDTRQVVAGGNGDGSAPNQFSSYRFIALNDGTLYISDFSNHRVQRWLPGDIEGHTVAGGNGKGSAANQLDGPMGVCITEQQELLIADFHNHRVVKWSPESAAGIVIAGGHGDGSSTHQLANPCDLAVGKNNDIFVLENVNKRVTQWGAAFTIELD